MGLRCRRERKHRLYRTGCHTGSACTRLCATGIILYYGYRKETSVTALHLRLAKEGLYSFTGIFELCRWRPLLHRRAVAGFSCSFKKMVLLICLLLRECLSLC